MNDILLIGQIVADVVVRPVDAFPRDGVCLMTDEVGIFPGGCTLNTALTMAKLGVRPRLMGKVGTDLMGTFLLDRIRAAELGTEGIVRTEKSSTAIVMVSSAGERCFYYARGGTETLHLDDIDLEQLDTVGRVHLSGVMKLEQLDIVHLLRRARDAGAITSMDVDYDSSGRWLETVAPYLEHLDLFLPSQDEAERITGERGHREMADFLLNRGVGTVVIKRAEKGCYLRTPDEELTIPAYNVEPVDTTGAGDAFVGGFLTGLLKGWELKRCAELANACGACAVSALGATTGVRSLEETLAMIAECGMRNAE